MKFDLNDNDKSVKFNFLKKNIYKVLSSENEGNDGNEKERKTTTKNRSLVSQFRLII